MNIVITNNINFLKKHLRKNAARAAYYILGEDKKSIEISRYLSSFKGAYEIPVETVELLKDFPERYVDFVRGLNNGNKTSRLWWCLSFTNKHPYISPFYQNLYDSIAAVKLIEAVKEDAFIIVSSDRFIGQYIKFHSAEKGIKTDIKISGTLNIKSILANMPYTFILLAFIRSLIRKTVFNLVMKRPVSLSNKGHMIITQIENTSFEKGGNFRDSYFGGLWKFLKDKKRKVITCGFTSCGIKNILKMAVCRKARDNIVYPLEYFISFSDLLDCLKEILFNYRHQYNIKPELAAILGKDVSSFIKQEIKRAYSTGQIFYNLSVYYAVKRLLNSNSAEKILYPFENRSWEKMILMAARESLPGVKLIGYQHAALTTKHLNFIMGKGEYLEMPFPDEIITMGHITKDMMSGLFNFPDDRLKAGCALRQSFASGKLKTIFPEKIKKILVILALNLREYIRVISFLDKALEEHYDYNIMLRPHPIGGLKNLEMAIRICQPKRLKYALDDMVLEDSLMLSDIVVYASSTIPLIAISMGIPVVYLDMGDKINYDPLFNMSYLKWSCNDPKRFNDTLGSIFKKDTIDFSNMQKKTREFALRYCVPATEENMGVFL